MIIAVMYTAKSQHSFVDSRRRDDTTVPIGIVLTIVIGVGKYKKIRLSQKSLSLNNLYSR